MVIVIPFFVMTTIFSDPPTAAQLNFPPCYLTSMRGARMMGNPSMHDHSMHDHSMEPTGYTKEDMRGSGMDGGMDGGYGMHNSSCPVTQLLETQCAPLNEFYNLSPWDQFEQRAAAAQSNYNRFCPSLQESVGNILGGLLSGAFLFHSRLHVAHGLGITDDVQTKQFGAAVYSLGTHSLLCCLPLPLCSRHRQPQEDSHLSCLSRVVAHQRCAAFPQAACSDQSLSFSARFSRSISRSSNAAAGFVVSRNAKSIAR